MAIFFGPQHHPAASGTVLQRVGRPVRSRSWSPGERITQIMFVTRLIRASSHRRPSP